MLFLLLLNRVLQHLVVGLSLQLLHPPLVEKVLAVMVPLALCLLQQLVSLSQELPHLLDFSLLALSLLAI